MRSTAFSGRADHVVAITDEYNVISYYCNKCDCERLAPELWGQEMRFECLDQLLACSCAAQQEAAPLRISATVALTATIFSSSDAVVQARSRREAALRLKRVYCPSISSRYVFNKGRRLWRVGAFAVLLRRWRCVFL